MYLAVTHSCRLTLAMNARWGGPAVVVRRDRENLTIRSSKAEHQSYNYAKEHGHERIARAMIVARKTISASLFGIFLILGTPIALKAQMAIDPAQARDLFARARHVSEKEGGTLWGRTLYGPILFVDPQTRAVAANQQDAEGVLKASDGVYTGVLPDSVILASTTIEWAGTHWTMLLWPMSGDDFTLDKTLEHEMFHRIQGDLGLTMMGPQNPHLGTMEGRVWLRLEWRALAAALASDDAARQEALSDACAFRSYRHSLFPGSSESERELDMSEGVPEYTGTVAASPDIASARWYEIAQLTSPDRSITFVRSFPYVVGPAFGILLDEYQPGWRSKLKDGSDLSAILCESIPAFAAASALERSARYGGAEIRAEEQEREQKLATQKHHYRSLLVEGPTLVLPNMGNFNFSFDPRELVSLGSEVTVYPTMHAKDSWGSLAITDGAIMAADFSSITVAAPTKIEGTELQGPGWTLHLADGWRLSPASRPGSYILQHK